jgi:hypothetical protein
MLRWTLLLLALAVGCAHRAPTATRPAPPFRFANDTFAFANETAWAYDIDERTGDMTWRTKDPTPDFVLRCGNMVAAARTFHLQARFAPDAPRVDDATYLALMREVIARDPRRLEPASDPVVLPGYPDLRTFSGAHEAAMKVALEGPWQSYLQRGNWRMIFPFTMENQRAEADEMVASVRAGLLPIVHIVVFPALGLNHLLLVYAVEETPGEIRFFTYDPNIAGEPLVFTWDRGDRVFHYPRTDYFAGGPVRGYVVYDGLLY